VLNNIAATLILNDDVDGAEDGLSEGISSFHNVCTTRDKLAHRHSLDRH
jgi:hypothetical protein